MREQRTRVTRAEREFNCTCKTIDFSDETLKSLKQLGEVLRRIRKRLDDEGYVLVDGAFVKHEKCDTKKRESGLERN